MCNAAVQTEVTSAMMDDEEKKHMEDDLEIETLQSELQSLVYHHFQKRRLNRMMIVSKFTPDFLTINY